MKQSSCHALSEIFLAQSELLGEGFDSWVNLRRNECLASFMLGGLPSSKDEKYRHTPLDALFSPSQYEMYFVGQTVGPLEALPTGGALNIVVENGFCKTPCTELENGVVYGSLKDAMKRFPQLLQKYLGSAADDDGDSLAALNGAFMQDGAFVYVPAGVNHDKGFVIDERYGSHDEAQMCFSRTLIVLEQGARTGVSQVWRTGGQTRFLIDAVRETVLGCGAELDFTEINALSGQSRLIVGSFTTQDSDSISRCVLCDSGCALSRYNLRTDLNAPCAQSELFGLYIVTGSQHADIAVNMRHNAPECKSGEVVKGIAADDAVGVFSGLVYVAPDAQKTDASQLNRNILVSETARIYTEPQLEIYADDVKCSHGATVGQLDDEAVYYMRQRGISLQEARRLQLSGFVNDIADKCRSGELCSFLHELTASKLEKL